MSDSTALDVLESCKLTLTLPESVFKLPWLPKFLERWSPNRRGAAPIARRGTIEIEIYTVDWEWEAETLETRDENGEVDSIEVRKDLSLNNYMSSELERLHRRLSSNLSALGIPFDCVFVDGRGSEPSIIRGRLDPQNASAYSKKFESSQAPELGEIISQIKDCKTLEHFEDVREWLLEQQPFVSVLKDELARFDAQLAEPGWLPFLEASAGFLSWTPKFGIYSSTGKLDWRPEAPAWIRSRFLGENPLERFERLGLPIPFPRLAEMTAICFAQIDPDEELLGATLATYCSSSAKLARAYRTPPRASMDNATHIGSCLDKMPSLANYLRKPESLSLFELELDMPTDEEQLNLPSHSERRKSPEQRALAEAHWLRAQILVSGAQAPSVPKRVKSL